MGETRGWNDLTNASSQIKHNENLTGIRLTSFVIHEKGNTSQNHDNKYHDFVLLKSSIPFEVMDMLGRQREQLEETTGGLRIQLANVRFLL